MLSFQMTLMFYFFRHTTGVKQWQISAFFEAIERQRLCGKSVTLSGQLFTLLHQIS